MKNIAYKAIVSLEKGGVLEFSMKKEGNLIVGSVTPNDNITKVVVFKGKEKIYEKGAFLLFVTGDCLRIALSIEKTYHVSEVFDEAT